MSTKSSNRADNAPSLSPAQREIMEIVWGNGEVSASQVREILAERRDVARNTVRTLLERMEAKRWLVHRVDGRTYLYSASVPRQTTIGQNVQAIVEQLCGGRPEQLVNALLDYRGLSAAELQKIQEILDQAKKKSRKKG